MAIDLQNYPITINKKLMADNKLVINFSIPTLEDLPIGSFLDVEGERYYLNRHAVIEKGGKDIWKYTLSLEADSYLLLRKRFLFLGSRKDTVLGNLEFFIDLLISNINETYPTWTKGVIDVTENKFITFDSIDCRGFLNQLAKEFQVEFDFFNREITAKKEVGQLTGYTFEYGQGKGLYKLTRKNVDSKETVTRVYGFGSSKNLPSDYGQTELTFSEKFVEDFSEFSDIIEADYTNDQIFPSFTGAVTSVVDDLTVTVPSMDFDLNAQLNAGQEAKVVFKSGDMLGREFVIKENSYNDITKTFTLIPDTDESGTTFPNVSLNIQAGDTLTFIDIHMPQSYIDEAEDDLKTATETFLEQNKSVRVVYDLVFDQRFLTRFGILPKPGDIVRIIDTDFGIDRNIRLASTVRVQANTLMTSFKATISDFIPISNQNRLVAKTIENGLRTEIVNSSNIELARQNTLKNRLLQDRLFDTDDFFDTDNIRPLSINTSFLSVGAKSQNFQLDGISIEPNFGADENRFKASSGTLRHLEVEGDAGKDWIMSALDQSSLVAGTFYYLYAKCSKTVANGVWLLSTNQELADQANDYFFLVGILYEVLNDFRQTSFTYGMTFINGKTITTGIITSIDGLNYFDLDSGEFKIGNATSSLDWNVTASNQLTLKGILVQNPGGSTSGLSVFRGAFNVLTVYYTDDTTTYLGGTWRFINPTPVSGVAPIEGIYWTIEAAAGSDGIDGVDGVDGNFVEYQYAKNGSTSVPPSIVVGDLNPVGWSIVPPVVGALEYLWLTKSTKNAAGTILIINWSDPTRISGVDGADGDVGPSPVFQGLYDNGKTYFGTSIRVDIVEYLGAYYVARTDAGTFSGTLPTNTAKWNPFGATFDSVATDLLFASLAVVENLIVQNLQTAPTGQRMEMSAAGNNMKWYDPSNDERVLIDDNLLFSRPAIRITEGSFYARKVSGTFSYMDELRVVTPEVQTEEVITDDLFVDGIKQITGTFTSNTDSDQFIDLSSEFNTACISGVVGGNANTGSLVFLARGSSGSGNIGLWVNRNNLYTGSFTVNYVAWGF